MSALFILYSDTLFETVSITKLKALDILNKMEEKRSEQRYKKRILFSTNNEFYSIDISDIGFFYSEDKYVYAVTKGGLCKITSYRSLNDLEEELNPYDFFRASRECIVSMDSIKKITKFFKSKLKIELRCGNFVKETQISAAKRSDFLAWLDK